MALTRYLRSPREIVFRLRQELGNLALYAFPPRGPSYAALSMAAPALDGAPYVALADEILAHRFALLGYTIATGPLIEWRRDYVHDRVTEPVYFRRVPYLDFERAGDHKIIWELNRHQHLVTLAQAWRFTGRAEYAREIAAQLSSWLEQNPPQRGINWASALEVAFRALSWWWVGRIGGTELTACWPAGLERAWMESLYQHGCHLELNLSVYFSPNTHLLGEAVALAALARAFPAWPRAQQWRALGDRTVREELDRQVLPDGAHFELSSYYHVYALDFFLFHAIEAGLLNDGHWRARLTAMGRYLHALHGAARRIPLLGDDDGGRLFHPYGERDTFGRATLATLALALDSDEWPVTPEDVAQQAAWWLGASPHTQPGRASKPQHFANAGLTVFGNERVEIVADAGGFGPFRAGHSHADALAITLRIAGRDVLIDPGTYSYLDPAWRDRFRSEAMHNTVAIEGHRQATPVNPFAWDGRPQVRLLDQQWSAECLANGARHRRTLLLKDDVLHVTDEIEAAGALTATQHWHFADEAAAARLLTPAIRESGWRSRVLGAKEPIPTARSTATGVDRLVLKASFDLR